MTLPSAYTELHPKARKQHWCCECTGAIQPGETYELYKGIWDGRAANYKTCQDCVELRTELQGDDGEFLFGGLWEKCDYAGRRYMLRFIDIIRRRSQREMPSFMLRIEERLKAEEAEGN